MENTQVNSNASETPVESPNDFAVDAAEQELEIDAQELEIAKAEAEESDDIFKCTFKRPATYDNLVITDMVFDWGRLTGQDSLDIENEMLALKKVAIVPEFSGEYLIRMAARASDPRVGADFFKRLPLGEYNKIRSAARSFLLKSE